MKFYISTTGIKRVTILNGGAVAGAAGGPTARRFSHRTVLPAVLILAIVLPFLFVRIALLLLDSASVCTSSFDCVGWNYFRGSDTSMLTDELMRVLMEANERGAIDDGGIEGSPTSFSDLVQDVTSQRQDLKAFALKTKAMLVKMERKVRSARYHESIYWNLASHGVPKSLHCLCLKLAEEYAVNSIARSRLPPPEFVSRLSDPSFHHIVLLTDNVLAASVVISSTITNSIYPGKLVFHVVTDKKTYTPMHAWFATNSIESAVVEVKGLHQFDWSYEVNKGVKKMLEIQRSIWSHYYDKFRQTEFELEGGSYERYMEALWPSCLSLMNNLRIYIPELFPELDKIVFLDDDVVVQHDLSSLWELDLDGKVIGAVVDSWCRDGQGDHCCKGRKYKDYFNFSDPIIASNLEYDRCGWLYGMNVFDLEAWRRTNITKTYHQWLKLNLDSGMGLWHPGALPPALLAFDGHMHPIDPIWHVAGLGYQPPEIGQEILKTAAVIHFNGPAKPWLEIGFREVRSSWTKHVNISNILIRKCRVMG